MPGKPKPSNAGANLKPKPCPPLDGYSHCIKSDDGDGWRIKWGESRLDREAVHCPSCNPETKET